MGNLSLGEAVLETGVDLDGLKRGLGSARGVADDLFGKIGDVVKGGLAIAAGAAIAAIGAIGTIAIKEAMEAQEVQAQLDQVLISTGGAAGVTSEMANDLASSLQKVTRFSDDTILSAETMLLRFKNISQKVFPDATKIALDLATVLKTDATSAAKLLGKALEEPGEGLNRLKQAGVSFTDEEEKIIKAMVEAGDAAGAQKFILDSLATSVGGAAEAAGKTFAGRIDILKNSLLDMAEGIGLKLLPIGEKLINEFILPAMPLLEQAAGAVANLIETFGQGDFSALTNLIPPELAAQLPALEAAVRNLAAAFVEQMPAMQAEGEKLMAWLQTAFGTVGPQVLTNVTTALNALAEFWREWGDEIIAATGFIFQVVGATIGGAITLLTGIITGGLQLLNGDWEGAWQTIVDTLAAFMNLALSIVGTNLTEFIATWQNNWNMLQTIVSTVTMQITSNFQTWIITTINSAKQFATDLIATLKGFYDTFVVIGQQWFDGITQGILLKVAQLRDAVVSSIMDTVAAARDALGISSPSLVFAEIGQQMMAGLGKGIASNLNIPELAMEVAMRGVTNTTVNSWENFGPISVHLSGNETTLDGFLRSLQSLPGGAAA